jgi:tetratricopeptide (TPR) repeat protein/NAD-dependent dihydropyrimidine dehydrogenase PreA subunit
MWYSGALPEFHLATDADGWASLATSNFWRNLPGPAVTAFTFLICGFAIVYLLGSRTFCTYVCPYGAVFGLADRLAPGRIRVTDACTQCGTCTAVCTSGIRVHEEVKQHGMIVNSSCLKDLNCVAACPSDALQYRFGKPSLLRSQSSGGRFGSVPYDFSVPEELLISTVFLVILLTFRGLYGHVPFLLSLALGIIAGALAVAAVRLWTKPEVIFARVWLKQRGKLTRNGKAFLAMAAFLVALVGHSSFIRYHEYSGLRAMALVDPSTPRHQVDQLHHVAWTHLQTADNWGLIRNPRAERQLMSAAFHLQHFDEAADLAERVVARNPDDLAIRLTLGQALLKTNQVLAAERTFEAIVERTRFLPKEHQAVCASAHHALGEILAQRGKFAAASNHLAEGVRLDPDNATLLAALGSLLAEIGEWRGALDGLTRAVELDPSLGRAHYNLGAIYARLGRFEEAVACYKKALAGEPEDVDVLNNLGFSLLRVGRAADACTYLQRALAIQPDSAAAHFNFGSALIALQRVQEGTAHLLRAVALDARYAKPLRNEQGN